LTTIDFNRAIQDAKGASFEALPQGDYDVEVAKADAVTSSSGKPMIKVTMRVVSGPYERRPIINQFVFSADNPTAVAIFFRHMKAFGLDEAFFAALGSAASLEPVASALVNRRARLTIGHREWQGETRNEVKAVKPYTGAPVAAPPPGPSAPGAGPAVRPPTGPTAPVPPPAAPPLPVAAAPVPAPQVQSVPQPPAPAPTSATPVPVATTEAAPSSAPASTAATSDAAAPAGPPKLPF